MTPLASVSLLGVGFFPSWGRLPSAHHSSVGAATAKVICSTGAVAANWPQGARQYTGIFVKEMI